MKNIEILAEKALSLNVGDRVDFHIKNIESSEAGIQKLDILDLEQLVISSYGFPIGQKITIANSSKDEIINQLIIPYLEANYDDVDDTIENIEL